MPVMTLLMRLAVEILPARLDTVGTVDFRILIGHRQAALVVGDVLIGMLEDFRIDEDQRILDRLAVLVQRLLEIDDQTRWERRPGSRRDRCRALRTSSRTCRRRASSGPCRRFRRASRSRAGADRGLRGSCGWPWADLVFQASRFKRWAARPQGLGERAFVEIVEFATDGKSVRQLAEPNGKPSSRSAR